MNEKYHLFCFVVVVNVVVMIQLRVFKTGEEIGLRFYLPFNVSFILIRVPVC